MTKTIESELMKYRNCLYRISTDQCEMDCRECTCDMSIEEFEAFRTIDTVVKEMNQQ